MCYAGPNVGQGLVVLANGDRNAVPLNARITQELLKLFCWSVCIYSFVLHSRFLNACFRLRREGVNTHLFPDFDLKSMRLLPPKASSIRIPRPRSLSRLMSNVTSDSDDYEVTTHFSVVVVHHHLPFLRSFLVLNQLSSARPEEVVNVMYKAMITAHFMPDLPESNPAQVSVFFFGFRVFGQVADRYWLVVFFLSNFLNLNYGSGGRFFFVWLCFRLGSWFEPK